jgi:hypothetical protein
MSADQNWRDIIQMLVEHVHETVSARTPFVRDGKLDLASNHIVGTVPMKRGGSGTNTGAEPALGNPATDGDVLSSTAAGVRSWITPAGAAALDDLTDVTITTPATGDLLTYDNSTSTWINQAPSGGSGAWTQIAIQTLASAAASVTFSSIPGTYRELLILWLAMNTGANAEEPMLLRANGDTGSNYDWGSMLLDYTGIQTNAQVAHGATSWQICNTPGTTAAAGSASSGSITLPYYANTSVRKGMIGYGQQQRDDTTSYGRNWPITGRWRSTSAITSLTFLSTTNNLAIGLTFALYGLT